MASNVHTITLDSNGGLPESYIIQIRTGQKVGALPTAPQRTGYTFVKWWRRTPSGDINELTSGMTYTFNKDVTYYAEWRGINRTVAFDSNGGSSVSPRTYTHGSVLGEQGPFPTPTLAGHDFLGWFDEREDYGVEVSVVTNVTKDMILYAHWRKKIYTVTFNPGNGQESTSVQVRYGDRLNYLPKDPERKGYTFIEWRSSGNIVTKSTIVTSNMSVSAVWNVITYTISYDVGGRGSVPSNVVRQYTVESPTITPPAPAEVVGYVFDGWNPENIPHGSIGNRWFEGSWSVRHYTITFDAQGGTPATQTKDITYGSLVGTLPTATKTGYTLAGWENRSPGFEGVLLAPTTGYLINRDATYYARWTANQYNITLDPGEGRLPESSYDENGDVKPIAIAYNSAIGSKLPTPTLSGNVFSGWFTAAAGGTLVNSQTIYSLTSDTTYYAQWSAWQYTIKFNGNRSTSGSMANQTFTYGVPTQLNQNQFQRKYTITYNASGGTCSKANETVQSTFLGWGRGSQDDQYVEFFDKQYITDLATSVNQTINLYAKWSMNTIKLPSASRTGGYTFKGWYDRAQTADQELLPETTAGYVGDIGSDYLVTANKTLYAHWHDDGIQLIYNNNFID